MKLNYLSQVIERAAILGGLLMVLTYTTLKVFRIGDFAIHFTVFSVLFHSGSFFIQVWRTII